MIYLTRSTAKNIRKILSLITMTFFMGHLASMAAIAPLGNKNAPKGGTFYKNLSKEPEKLNPITSSDYYASQVQAHVMEGLMERNVDTYEWKPKLALSHKIDKTGKIFDFKIRKGVKWHDGKPLTPEDVKFSFDVIFDPKYPTAHIRPYYDGIKSAEIIAPDTVRFVAKNKYFRNFDSIAGLQIVPKHIYQNIDKKKLKKLNRVLIGTGPYILDKYEKGRKIHLKRNTNWWGNALPEYKGEHNLSKVVFRFISEDSIALEMLKKGRIDFKGLKAEDYVKKAKGPKWGKDVFKVKTENRAPKGYNYIGWNLQKDIFKDVEVRKALAELMNRPLMIKKFKYEMSLPAVGPWYPQSLYADGSVAPLKYSIKKALKRLKKAGWADSNKDRVLDKTFNGVKKRLEFTIITANEDIIKYLTIYKEDAKKAGVVVNIKRVEWNTLLKLIDEKKFDAISLGWSGGSLDVDPKQIWHSSSAVKGGSNFISYKNPKVDALIDEARQISDRPLRVKKMQEVYRLIAADAPYLFMFTPKYTLYGHTKKMSKKVDTYQFAIGLDYWWVTK